MATRTAAAIVSLVLVGAVLTPLARDPVDDGFPLSTYPMFAVPRSTMLEMSYPVGVTSHGTRRMLALRHLGTGEVMQAFVTLQDASDAGPHALDMLCAAIADRVHADRDYADVVAIRIVSGTHDAIDYFVRDRRGDERDRAYCDVAPRIPRGTP